MPAPPPDRSRIAGLIAGNPWVTILLAVLITAATVVPASRVRFDPDIVRLLPEGSEAAAAYRLFLDRFGGLERIFLVIRAADEASVADLPEIVEHISERLSASPLLHTVRAGVTPEDERFLLENVVERAPLLLADGWRRQVAERIEPEAIRKRVARIRTTLISPHGDLELPLYRHDPFGFATELGLRAAPVDLPVDEATLLFLTPDRRAALLLLTPAVGEVDPEGGRALEREIDAAVVEAAGSYGARIEHAAIGGPLYAAHDEAILRGDLSTTLTGSILACGAVLVVAFAGLSVPVAAAVALALALVWTLASAGLVFGALSPISVGFAAVLVGLGLDYAIHGGARFREEVARDGSVEAAFARSWRAVGPAVATSAATTAGAFAVLSAAHFKPLRELGVVVGLGIGSVLVATATVGGAVLVVSARRRRWRRPLGRSWRLMGVGIERAVGIATTRSRTVLATAALLTLAGVVGLATLRLDADLRALRPVDHPSLQAERFVTGQFDIGLDTATVVVPGDNLSTALSRAGRASSLLQERLPEADVLSPSSVLAPPERTDLRLAELATMGLGRGIERMEEELRAAGLAPAGFAAGLAAFRRLAVGIDPAAGRPVDGPDWVDQLLREANGAAWAAVRVRLPSGVWPNGPPEELLAELEEVAPGSAVASATALGRDVREVARIDMERLSLLAMLAVIVAVLASFRGRLGPAAMAMIPVSLGTVWTVGLWSLLGGTLDLISLAVVPIVLGIGIDDGLHAMHGARREGGVAPAVRSVGRAMLLTTVTTGVAFASLFLSHVPGLRTGGILTAVGVVACLLATVLVLPALESVAARWRRRR